MASGLLETGMKPGDRLGLMGSNSAEWEITLLASIKAGLVVVSTVTIRRVSTIFGVKRKKKKLNKTFLISNSQVNINPLYMKQELHHCLSKVDAKMLVALEFPPQKDYYELLKSIIPEIAQQPYGKPVTTRHLSNLEFIVMNTDENLP